MAAQLLSALARARQVRELADLVGQAALPPADRAFLEFDEAFGHGLVDQRPDELRTLEETLERAWRVLLTLPRGELAMLPAALLDARLAAGEG